MFGSGPVDVLLVPGFVSHIDYAWEEPLLGRFLRRLSAFARVIAYDKRGMGLSDRDPAQDTPSAEQRIADLVAVLDAAGSRSAAVLAWSEGGPTAITFSVSHPDRTSALVLIETTARFTRDDDYPVGIPREVVETFIETLQLDWGTGVGLELYAPSVCDDERFREWWAAFQRFSATPGAVAATLRMQLSADARPLLARVAVPTLVMHRSSDMVIPVECGRYLAEHIASARYYEPNSEDHMYWVGDQNATLTEFRAFLAGTRDGAALRDEPRSRRRRASVGWEALTESELDVVRLLGTGMTNQQIADRLTISPRTVQTHVTHILAKLGLRRRAEVAAELARSEL